MSDAAATGSVACQKPLRYDKRLQRCPQHPVNKIHPPLKLSSWFADSDMQQSFCWKQQSALSGEAPSASHQTEEVFPACHQAEEKTH